MEEDKRITPGRDALILFFSFSFRPSVAETRETWLPRCQHLTPDVFSCPRCLSQTKRKINKAFSPPFPL